MADDEKKVEVNGASIDAKDVQVTVDGESVEAKAIEVAKSVPEHPAVARLRKMRGRRLDRMAFESRFRVHPPGSAWKRRDGTTAKAGPKYGEAAGDDAETDTPGSVPGGSR